MAKTVSTQKPNSLTLDQLFGIAEVDYTSLEVEVAGTIVELRPSLRLSKEERAALGKVTDGIGDKDKDGNEIPEDERLDGLDVYHKLFRLLAATPEQAELLISAIGDRLDVFKTLQDQWVEKTQPGEAKSSAS